MIAKLFWITMLVIYLILVFWSNGTVSVSSNKVEESDIIIRREVHDNTTIAPSPQKLIDFSQMEGKISKMLREHSQTLIRQTGLISDYLHDFDDSTRGSEYTKNPISAYRMIRRYVKLLRNLQDNLSRNTFSATFKEILDGESESAIVSSWPADLDLENAMDSIIRLHQVYDFNVEEFADGNILGVTTPHKLDTVHCREIGEYAVKIEHYSSGVLWLETALEMERTSPNTTNFDTTKWSLEYAKETHDIAWDSREEDNYNFFISKLNATEDRTTLRRLPSKLTYGNQENSANVDKPFWDLCTGQNHQSEAEKSQLFCRYETKSNPAWRINPLKIEQLSNNPPLIQIYDILGPQTIRDIKEQGNLRMRRGQVTDYTVDGVTYISPTRTAMDSWIGRGSNVSRRIRHKGELITGLNILSPKSSENLVLAYYAFGGHYVAHLDAFHKLKLAKLGDWGNRIATLLFYLDDIEVGGYTAFPKIGVAVKPVKGSAIFFYNLQKNGDFEYRSVHGACPVVLGHKSIATIFIRANSQMFKRPCEIDSYYGDD